MTTTANTAVSHPWPTIASLARWSPSIHNTQAWKLRPLSPASAELRYDPTRLLALADADGRFWTIGLGVFTTCLEVAAASLGYRLTVTYPETRLDPRAVGSQFFANLDLWPGAPVDPLDASVLETRRTSRIPYDGRPVPARDVAELAAIAEAGGQRAMLHSDPDTVAWVNGLNIDTLILDMRDRAIREETAPWIRRSNREAARRGDGFAPRCLGINGHLLHLFFHRHWLFDQPGVRDAVRAFYARAYRGTATVGWIAGPQETPAQWFEAGRALGRMWLTAAARGLVLHPYGSVITNPEAHARLVERIRSEEPGIETWLLFRIGYSARPARSARLPAAAILE